MVKSTGDNFPDGGGTPYFSTILPCLIPSWLTHRQILGRRQSASVDCQEATLRTSPWSGQATTRILLQLYTSCLPLRGSVRNQGGGVNLRTIAPQWFCSFGWHLEMAQVPSPWPQQAPFQAMRPAAGTTGSISESCTRHIQPLNGYRFPDYCQAMGCTKDQPHYC